MKNTHIKRIAYICLFISFQTCNISSSFSKEVPPEEAIKTAESFLDKLKPKLKLGEVYSDFQSDVDVDNLVIGIGYKSYLIDNQKLSSTPNVENLESIMKFRMWTFLVMGDGNIKLTIHIKNKNGVWQIAGFGKPLQGLNEIKKIWPTERGYSFSVVIIPGRYVFAFIKENELNPRDAETCGGTVRNVCPNRSCLRG